jgi:hypothetical protein
LTKAKSLKFPEGMKVKCVLLNTQAGTARLVLDNHAPFGYHLHTELPHDKKFRLLLNLRSYQEAIKIFFEYARKIADET